MNCSDARRLLEIELATAFAMSPSGRMLHENDPEHSAAPKMVLTGCADGNILLLNDAIGEKTARDIDALAAGEPVLDKPDSAPLFANRYRALLGVAAPPNDRNFGLRFRLPNDLPLRGTERFVCHDTAEGNALCARLARDGMPPNLIGMGFPDLTHFWAPWCVALDDDEIASITFAARLGAQGASLGLATMPEFRGRGFGAAVTARWSSLPALKDCKLFYGTDRANVSSRRVTERLGLEFLGASFRL